MVEKRYYSYKREDKSYYCVVFHRKDGYYGVKLYDKNGLFKRQLNKNDEGCYFHLMGVESMINQAVWKLESRQDSMKLD